MDTLQKEGGKLIYDPQFLVYRRPRPNLKTFARMLRTYGRGRAEQFRVHPTFGSALNFAPPLFLVYLGVLFVALFVAPTVSKYLLILLGIYCAAVLSQALALIPRAGIGPALGAIPLIMLTHVLYGYGFWRGLFTTLKRGNQNIATEVNVEKIQ